MCEPRADHRPSPRRCSIPDGVRWYAHPREAARGALRGSARAPRTGGGPAGEGLGLAHPDPGGHSRHRPPGQGPGCRGHRGCPDVWRPGRHRGRCPGRAAAAPGGRRAPVGRRPGGLAGVRRSNSRWATTVCTSWPWCPIWRVPAPWPPTWGRACATPRCPVSWPTGWTWRNWRVHAVGGSSGPPTPCTAPRAVGRPAVTDLAAAPPIGLGPAVCGQLDGLELGLSAGRVSRTG